MRMIMKNPNLCSLLMFN